MKAFANTIVRDRDYIQDMDGNILRIIGDSHPNDCIISFVKYYPAENGKRIINNIKYGYNTYLYNSLMIMRKEKDRIRYSDQVGSVVTVTPNYMVQKYYSCREKVQDILRNQSDYYNHPIGKHLVCFLNYAKEYVKLEEIGVTGSFLFDAQNDKSDIDLVCYGEKSYKAMHDIFKNSDFIQPYEDGLERQLFMRRMTHMAAMDLEALIMQESRKLQGVVRGSNIHINCQPLREDDQTIKDSVMEAIGEIGCNAAITDDTEGLCSPAIYRIKVLSIVHGTADDRSIKNEVKYMISYFGDFAQNFRNGDIVYLEGKLVRIIRNNAIEFGIEMTSWTGNKSTKAILLR